MHTWPAHLSLQEPSDKEGSLRLALLTDRPVLPAAVRDLLGDVLRGTSARLVGSVGLESISPTPEMRLFEGLDWLDFLLHGAVVQQEKTSVASGAAALEEGAFPVHVQDGHLVPGEAALQQLRRLDADVLLCLTHLPPRLPADIARWGAIGIEAGHGVPVLASWAAAGEFATGSPMSLRLMDYAGEARECHVACVGVATSSSLRRCREDLLLRGGAALKRHLERLAAGQASVPLPRLLEPLADRRPSQAPTAGLLARTLLQAGRRWLHNRWSKRPGHSRDRSDAWHLAYALTDIPLPDIPFADLCYLAPPPGHFWADPFAVELDGRHWIVFEDMPADRRRACLRAVEVNGQGIVSAPVLVLERPFHLSYPYLFQWEGGLYLLPETRQARHLELLRCVVFPDRWVSCGVLLDDVQAVDATLWHDEATGRWWMFANQAGEGVATADELHLYWAESPLGPWEAHPHNPLCGDARCSRPAGPLFRQGMALYRPSQDGGRRYGEALWINSVDQLDTAGFVETPQRRIAADWHPAVKGVHTIGRAGRLTVLDCVIEGVPPSPVQSFT
ncbi:hypothetical protein MASR1M60_19040 [Rhodocyclaceae bacterium]